MGCREKERELLAGGEEKAERRGIKGHPGGRGMDSARKWDRQRRDIRRGIAMAGGGYGVWGQQMAALQGGGQRAG